MASHPRPDPPAARSPRRVGASLLQGAENPAGEQSSPINWPHWLRLTERKRRLAAGCDPRAVKAFLSSYSLSATDTSFRLEGINLPPGDLAAALARGGAARALRSRQQQRVRNHVAILRHVESLLRRRGTLKSSDVVRWYTSVACGLSTTQLDEPSTSRLDGVVRQINSPPLRLRPAVQGIARLHRQMLADPVVPSFNGILARLLLRYHLGRCGLPPVVFVLEIDGGARVVDEQRLLRRLLELIDQTYAALLRDA